MLRPGGYLIVSDLYLRRPAGDAHPTGFPEGIPVRGTMTRDTLETLLCACGFTPCFWEDHTPLLRELAARLVLSGASLEGLCPGAVAGERPGYYLLVAQKINYGG